MASTTVSRPEASSLSTKLQAISAELKDEYLQAHDKPWIIGFSGGKDSTLVLQLVFDLLLRLPPSRRTRPVHVLSNDTLVESPVVQAYIDRVLGELSAAVEALNVSMVVKKTTPDPDGTFWVNLIGRGYPAPNRLFRWCTDRMKIRPTTAYMREQISKAGEVILLLGVRRLESSARAKVVGRYSSGGRLNPHNDMKGCLIFRPIVELTTEEVWMTLLQSRPPWGGSHRDLATLYRNADGGECPFVTDGADVPSCGTSSSRFGCWTCTVVEKDRSMQGFIDNGFDHLEPLAAFRDWLKEFSRDPQNRMNERRNGHEGMGPFTLLARREILQQVQQAARTTGLPLISQAEVERIEQIWLDDQSMLAVRKADRLLALIE